MRVAKLDRAFRQSRKLARDAAEQSHQFGSGEAGRRPLRRVMRPASLATETSEEECCVSSHLLAIAAPGAKWPDEGSDAWLKVGNRGLKQGTLMQQPVIHGCKRQAGISLE